MKFTLVRPILCVAALLMAGGFALAYPRPSAYPLSWELGFEHSKPKRVAIRPKGTVDTQAFWYVTFTVTNSGREEQRFLPVFEMLTEDGRVIRSDKDIPPVVLETIRIREKNKHLQSINEIAGAIRPGVDQAREGVAIWREPSPEMGQFSIFVKGLSGESTFLTDEQGKPVKLRQADGKEESVVLFKTLQVRYHMAGDEKYPGNDAVEKVDEQWIMR